MNTQALSQAIWDDAATLKQMDFAAIASQAPAHLMRRAAWTLIGFVWVSLFGIGVLQDLLAGMTLSKIESVRYFILQCVFATLTTGVFTLLTSFIVREFIFFRCHLKHLLKTGDLLWKKIVLVGLIFYGALLSLFFHRPGARDVYLLLEAVIKTGVSYIVIAFVYQRQLELFSRLGLLRLITPRLHLKKTVSKKKALLLT